MDSIKPLKIDIISDPVCPWCAIGFYRLRQALNRVKGTLAVKISWHPFELNPTMAPQGENLREHLAKKYGTTLEQSIRARKMLAEFLAAGYTKRQALEVLTGLAAKLISNFTNALAHTEVDEPMKPYSWEKPGT